MATDLAPALLVAMDLVLDPHFRRTVVLMLEHEVEQGALGLIVNRASEFPMAQLCESLKLPWRGDPAATVDWGGPVGENQGFVLLDDDAARGLEVSTLAPGLHWTRSQEALRRVAELPRLGERPPRPPQRARVFLGCAGWAPGQLEHEIAEGSWLVVPLLPALVFDTSHERLWTEAVRSLGIEPATLVPSQGVN